MTSIVAKTKKKSLNKKVFDFLKSDFSYVLETKVARPSKSITLPEQNGVSTVEKVAFNEGKGGESELE